MFEYRVGWSASSNSQFYGASEWFEWMGDEATESDVSLALTESTRISVGLETAIEVSGFEWYVEVREIEVTS